jgi:hypothetical protein
MYSGHRRRAGVVESRPIVPIAIDADDERRLLVATATGNLTFAGIREFIRTARSGERRVWRLLFDMTGATSDITAEHVRSLAVDVGSAVRNQGVRAPVAIIAGTDEMFGVMRMYQILCEQQGVDVIQVFRTRKEADAWLGL